jgi:hypothetical protein
VVTVVDADDDAVMLAVVVKKRSQQVWGDPQLDEGSKQDPKDTPASVQLHIAPPGRSEHDVAKVSFPQTCVQLHGPAPFKKHVEP